MDRLSVTATKDTSIRLPVPNAPDGHTQSADAVHGPFPPGTAIKVMHQALFEFDVTAIARGSTIMSAVFEFRHWFLQSFHVDTGQQLNGGKPFVVLNQLSDTFGQWDEHVVTWSTANGPIDGSELVSDQYGPLGALPVYDPIGYPLNTVIFQGGNVLQMVKSWVDNPNLNFGVVVSPVPWHKFSGGQGPLINVDAWCVHSKESQMQNAYPPTLTVMYDH